jgi:hypothetical protein
VIFFSAHVDWCFPKSTTSLFVVLSQALGLVSPLYPSGFGVPSVPILFPRASPFCGVPPVPRLFPVPLLCLSCVLSVPPLCSGVSVPQPCLSRAPPATLLPLLFLLCPSWAFSAPPVPPLPLPRLFCSSCASCASSAPLQSFPNAFFSAAVSLLSDSHSHSHSRPSRLALALNATSVV